MTIEETSLLPFRVGNTQSLSRTFVGPCILTDSGIYLQKDVTFSDTNDHVRLSIGVRILVVTLMLQVDVLGTRV